MQIEMRNSVLAPDDSTFSVGHEQQVNQIKQRRGTTNKTNVPPSSTSLFMLWINWLSFVGHKVCVFSICDARHVRNVDGIMAGYGD